MDRFEKLRQVIPRLLELVQEVEGFQMEVKSARRSKRACLGKQAPRRLSGERGKAAKMREGSLQHFQSQNG